MANLRQLFKSQTTKPALIKEIIEKEIRKINLIRSFMLSGLSVPIALVLSFTYAQVPQTNIIQIIDWKRQILTLNITVAVVMTILFAVTLYAYYRPALKKMQMILPHVVLIVLALWGTTCSIYDQAVTSSIIAFLVICVVCSLSLLVHPVRLFCYLTVIYIYFGVGISKTQYHNTFLMSNLSLGLITMIVCLGLATIQWRSSITRFKQRRQIKSQKKELEQNYKALLNTSEELKQVNEMKDRFFSILAHDLRGPISSTLALTELLEEGMFEQDETERKRMYKLLQTSLFTTGKLLENVLLWSRSQTGNIAFKPVKINVYEAVEANINLLKIMAAQKDITIINQTDQVLDISGDMDMINTIFRNLISNAIKFTPNFGKIEIISGYCDDAGGAQQVMISVKDYGVGMNVRALQNLFRADSKTASPGTNNEMGTGLGLVLCKEFVQKHAGDILVESQESFGSTFTIKLPVQRAVFT